MPPDTRAFRVGLLILTAFAVLAAGVFLIGEKNNLFSRKMRYYVEFNSVSGLKPGNPVQLNGVDVGTVSEVVLPQNPNEEGIQVWITVDNKYAARIRGPVIADGPPGSRAAPGGSQARIKTLGLLGDKFIELSTGGPEFPAIPNEGEIPAAQPTNVDALMASGEDVMDNVVEISASLSTILSRMESGEGLLGELLTDSESGRRLRTSLIGTTESLERIATTIEKGEGPLGRLLNDKAMADQLASSLDRFEALLAQAQTGPGLAPALLNDPQMKTSFQDTLAQLNQVARDVQGMTADLETSQALLPRLLKDEEYGREITGEVETVVKRLSEASRLLTEGEGSVPKLLNDPQVYDAVNDIIIGVNESRILRWLIRNRQKKGIERRYEDTREGLEAQGQTPPPLDAGPDTTEEPPPPGAPPVETPEAAPAPEPTPPPLTPLTPLSHPLPTDRERGEEPGAGVGAPLSRGMGGDGRGDGGEGPLRRSPGGSRGTEPT